MTSTTDIQKIESLSKLRGQWEALQASGLSGDDLSGAMTDVFSALLDEGADAANRILAERTTAEGRAAGEKWHRDFMGEVVAKDAAADRRIRYATSKLNTSLAISRLGAIADDTFRVTVYRDGVADSFTAHGERVAEILTQFSDDGFYVKQAAGRESWEAWVR